MKTNKQPPIQSQEDSSSSSAELPATYSLETGHRENDDEVTQCLGQADSRKELRIRNSKTVAVTIFVSATEPQNRCAHLSAKCANKGHGRTLALICCGCQFGLRCNTFRLREVKSCLVFSAPLQNFWIPLSWARF